MNGYALERQQAYDRAIGAMVRGTKPRRYVQKMRSDMRKVWQKELNEMKANGIDPFEWDGSDYKADALNTISVNPSIGKSMFPEKLKLGG